MSTNELGLVTMTYNRCVLFVNEEYNPLLYIYVGIRHVKKKYKNNFWWIRTPYLDGEDTTVNQLRHVRSSFFFSKIKLFVQSYRFNLEILTRTGHEKR